LQETNEYKTGVLVQLLPDTYTRRRKPISNKDKHIERNRTQWNGN
jgi:hypothetical protein